MRQQQNRLPVHDTVSCRKKDIENTDAAVAKLEKHEALVGKDQYFYCRDVDREDQDFSYLGYQKRILARRQQPALHENPVLHKSIAEAADADFLHFLFSCHDKHNSGVMKAKTIAHEQDTEYHDPEPTP